MILRTWPSNNWIYIFSSSARQAIDAKTIKDVCTKYMFNKAPAIAAVGMYEKIHQELLLDFKQCTL